MFEGTVFVVGGPPSRGFRCLGSRLRYGPIEAPDGPPEVKFYDAGDQRFRYMTATAGLSTATGHTVEWDNAVGHWRCRPLTNADQSWALPPDYSFATFTDFKAWCEWYADANLGQPVLPL
jgi:hypothetical protein